MRELTWDEWWWLYEMPIFALLVIIIGAFVFYFAIIRPAAIRERDRENKSGHIN